MDTDVTTAVEAGEQPIQTRNPLRSLVTMVEADLSALAIMPTRLYGALAIIGVAVLAGIAVGYARIDAPQLYTQSVGFVLFAAVIGALGRTPGLALWVTYAISDVFWLSQHELSGPLSGLIWPTGQLIGRAGSTVFLLVLVAIIPSLGRLAGAAVWRLLPGDDEPGISTRSALLPAAIAGLVTGALVFVWATYAPEVANGATPQPAGSTLYNMEDNWLFIAGVAGLASAAAWWLITRRIGLAGDAVAVLGSGPEWSLGSIVRRAIVTVAALLVVWSIIVSPIDFAILALAVIVGEAGAFLAGRTTFGRTVRALPFLVRLTVAIVVPLVVLLAGVALYFGDYVPPPPTPFFPDVLAFGLGFIAVRVLLVASPVDAGATTPTVTVPKSPVVGLLVIGAVGLAWFGIPLPAFADDCYTFRHCAATLLAGTAAAAALPTIVAASMFYNWLRQLDRETKESKRWMFKDPPAESKYGGQRFRRYDKTRQSGPKTPGTGAPPGKR